MEGQGKLEVVGRLDMSLVKGPLAALLMDRARKALGSDVSADPAYPALMEHDAQTRAMIERGELVLDRLASSGALDGAD